MSRWYGRKKPGQKKLADFAVFGFPHFGVMIVRPPTRVYGYGAMLGAYLAALHHARERRLAVYFHVMPDEPAGSLQSLSATGVRIIRPTPTIRVLLTGLWKVRLAWAHLRTRGRIRRARRFIGTVKLRLLERLIEVLGRMRKRVKTALKEARAREKARPRAQPPVMRQIGGWADSGWPSVYLRAAGAEERRCRRQAAGFGIDMTRPVVTVHVREAGWRGKLYSAGDRPMDAVRNADFGTYRPALELLQERGYQIVRFGDATMEPVPLDSGIVDLAHAGVDQLFQLWVVGQSTFMLGSDSGPIGLAALTGTPLLLVNSVHLVFGTRRPIDRFICKIAYRPGTRDPMSLGEMIDGGYLSCESAPTIGSMDEPYRDNSSDEIVEAVEEMLAVVAHLPEELPITPAQRAYHDLLADAYEALAEPGEYGPGPGRICDGFARRWLGARIAGAA